MAETPVLPQSGVLSANFCRATTGPDRGTGLGLATVLGIVEAHEGSIEICPGLEGRGTTMRVFLPAGPAVPRPSSPPPPVTTRAKGSGTVLVVDDNPLARATAVHLFEDLGFKVVDAYNGATALQLLAAHPDIGLLFVDVRMPGMSGPELAEAARRARPQLKIVFTSGYVGRKDVPPDVPFVPEPWRVDAVAEAISGAGSENS